MESTPTPIARFDGIALPFAFVIVAIAMLAWSIVGTTSITQGLPLTLFAMGLLIAAVVRYRPHAVWLIGGHVLIVGFLILGASHLCASRCGQFPFYDSIGPLPTAGVGILLHATLALIGILSFRLKIPTWVYCVGLAAAAGGSLFFASLMIAHAHWCAACAASHAVMVVLLVQAFRLLPQPLRVSYGLATLVFIGLVNALFHHQPYQTVRNDPAELLSWLRGQERSSTIPVGFLQAVPVVTPEAVPAPTIAGAPARATAAATPAPNPAVDRAAPATAPARPMAAPSGRDALLGVWGDPRRKVRLVANLDPTCPYCAKALGWLMECKDLIDAPGAAVSVDFELTYRRGQGGQKDIAGELGCYLIYAASYQGEEAMLAVMHALMSDPGRIAMRDAGNAMSDPKNRDGQRQALANLFDLLPGQLDKTVLQHYMEQHRGDIETKIKSTYSRMAEFGVPEAPNLWFYRTDRPATEPFALFRGAKEPEVLRYAVTQGLTDKQ